MYDVLFGAYLVKHVPEKGEKATGFWAKFESMGDYGDKFAAKREARKIAKEQQMEEESKESKESETETSDEEKDKPKAKAKAKPKAKAKATKK